MYNYVICKLVFVFVYICTGILVREGHPLAYDGRQSLALHAGYELEVDESSASNVIVLFDGIPYDAYAAIHSNSNTNRTKPKPKPKIVVVEDGDAVGRGRILVTTDLYGWTNDFYFQNGYISHFVMDMAYWAAIPPSMRVDLVPRTWHDAEAKVFFFEIPVISVRIFG